VERFLPWSRTARLVIRTVLAILCFFVAIVLSVVPGPAFVFWIAGFVLLGFSVGQILLSVHAVQEFLRRRVPYADRLPKLRKHQIRRLMRHRWVRMLDSLSGHRERRRLRREARRASAHSAPTHATAARRRERSGS
jgi:hypothetical protein